MQLWLVLMVTYAIVQNFGLAAIESWLIRRQKSWPQWLGWLPFLWAVLMVGLFVISALAPPGLKTVLRDSFYFPMSVQMVWNVLVLQALFPVMILVLLITRLRHQPSLPAEPASPADMSRRRFIYLVGLGAAPATAIGMGVHGSTTLNDLRVRKYDLALPNLPPELEGFTIAHVSDLHSGIFVGPERMKIISDMTNDLKAQMIVMTGDVINREMNEFPAALTALKRLEAPHGIYLCEGNHDIIPGYRSIVNACNRNGLPMLFNTCSAIPFGTGRLMIGGLSWDSYLNMGVWPDAVSRLFPARQPGDVRVLLAHHPDLFDIAQDADLVLSGHTHGGQIMFGDQVGLGRLRFKYCSGLFQRDNTTMIVSNGCGDWFPCRIGAPAEVGLLTLKKAT
jgi:predicted MPP superfamily phosphohydrolase